MTDYVSVNPPRVQSLADAMSKAAADIPGLKSTIKNGISGWDGEWDSAKVDELITFLQSNYKMMQDRADLAATAAHDAVATNMNDPHASWRSIPWNVTAQDKATEGFKDANNIKGDLNSGDKDAVARGQKELANALKQHADDPDWMKAFLANGGSQVVVDGDKSVLDGHLPPSDDGKKLLAAYANGTAALTKYAQTAKLPDDQLSPFYSQDNVVPVAVMMKFGPKGTAYGSQYLTGVGKAALDWRDHNREPVTDMKVLSSGMASGIDQKDGSWWKKYGIDVDFMDSKPDDIERGTPLITEYDPVQAILDRVGDDHKASNGILSGKDGPHYAKLITDPKVWEPGGYLNFGLPAKGAAKVLQAGTNRTLDGKAGAEAAANIFEQAAKNSEDFDHGKDLYPSDLSRAMSAMASGYTADFARSVGSGDPNLTAVVDGKEGPEIQTNRSTINGFLKLMMNDPTAAGSYKGAVDAQVQAAAYANAKWPGSDETTNLLYQTGFLKGMTQVALNDQGFQDAALKDATNARNKAYTDAVVGIIGSVPGLPGPASFIYGAGRSIYAASSSSIFPTDNAANATRDAQYTTVRAGDELDIPTAQGFADSGAYPTPKNASFVHTDAEGHKVISPQNEQQAAEFQNWWSKLPDKYANINDGKDGYNDSTNAKSGNDDSYDPPHK